MRKFLILSMFLWCLNFPVIGQWKVSVITVNQKKKVKFQHCLNEKVEFSNFFDDILLPNDMDSVLNDSMRSELLIRMSHKNQWGLMDGNFKILLKSNYQAIDLLIESNLLNPPMNSKKAIAIIGKRSNSLFIFDLKGKKLHKANLTSVQAIGCDLIEPTILSDIEKKCIFKDRGHFEIPHLFEHPQLLVSKDGLVSFKEFRFKKMVEFFYFDSFGVENFERRFVDTTEYFQTIVKGKWNILDLETKKLRLNKWADSLGFTLIHGQLNVPQNLKNLNLDSFIPASNFNQSFYLSSTNLSYQNNFEKNMIQVKSESQFYYYPFIVLYFENDLLVLNGNSVSQIPELKIRFSRNIGLFNYHNQIYWKSFDGKQYDLFNLLSFKNFPILFDRIDGSEEFYYQNDTQKIQAIKCQLNGKFGLFSFSENKFYPLTKLQDIQLSDGVYMNPFEYFSPTKNIFYLAKSNHKWGVSTLNIIQSKDSVLVPFLYDTLIPEKYYGLTILKAKLNDRWFYIDYLNQEIDIPLNTDQFFYAKRFFDVSHAQLSSYFLLINPTGTRVKNAFYLDDRVYSDIIPEMRYFNTYNGNIIQGGKFLIYNEMLRKQVDESLYDSIWLIQTNSTPVYSSEFVNVNNYEYFNPSNMRNVSEMLGSSTFYSIPYFLIFKDGKKTIITDQNKMIFPFTSEDIEIKRNSYREIIGTVDTEFGEENLFKYVSKLVFKTKSSQIEVNFDHDF